MSVRLRVVASEGNVPVAAEIALPCAGKTFTMSPLGARQLGEHLIKLAALCEDAEAMVE